MVDVICIALILITIIVGVRLYVKSTCKKFAENVDLTGKTVIVTGSNAGIGKELVLELVNRNARVIIACRSEEKAVIAIRYVQSRSTSFNCKLLYMPIDLSSLASVRSFAAEFIKHENRLDILVNNAGVNGQKVEITKDGLDLTYSTNYFGPFLLTNLLLDLLKKSGPGSRIINIGSMSHTGADLDLDFLDPEKIKFYIKNRQKSFLKRKPEGLLYFNSKLMNLMFTVDLAGRLDHSGVTVLCVHPGIVRTRMIRENRLVAYLFRIFLEILAKSPIDGCQPILHCMLSTSLDGVTGKYFGNFVEESNIHKMVRSKDSREKLCRLSEIMTGLRFTNG